MVATARCGASSSGGQFLYSLIFVYLSCLLTTFSFDIGQTYCWLHSTSHSDCPTVSQYYEAAPGHPSRWIGYDGDCSCFIRRPRGSSSQSRFMNIFQLFFFCEQLLLSFLLRFAYDLLFSCWTTICWCMICLTLISMPRGVESFIPCFNKHVTDYNLRDYIRVWPPWLAKDSENAAAGTGQQLNAFSKLRAASTSSVQKSIQSCLVMGGLISKLAVISSPKRNSLKETPRSNHLDYQRRHDSTVSLPGIVQVSIECTVY